jgi:hypothetical protein
MGPPNESGLYGGVCLLDMQLGRHRNRPLPQPPRRVTAPYGDGPIEQYFIGLENYSGEPIPVSGGPA